MKFVRLMAAAAIVATGFASQPEPVEAEVPWGYVACKAVCAVVGGTCGATNTEIADRCLVFWHGCVDGCDIA